MKQRARLLIASALVVLVSATAQAVVLHTNPYDPASQNRDASWYATDIFNDRLIYRSFADYTWDGVSTFTDFHWWGSSNWTASGPSDISGFTFQIWSNDAGSNMPRELLYNQFIQGNAGATFVETNAFYDLDVYQYSLDLSTPFTPGAPGNYWFSVVAHSDFGWYWAQGSDIDFNADWTQAVAYGSQPEEWFNQGQRGDFAFTLTGTTPDDTAPIPEPGTMSLLGLGLAGVAMRVRRKKS